MFEVAERLKVGWRMVGVDSARQIVQVAADRLGRFEVSGALPGEYLVAAVATPPEFWMAPDYLQTIVSRAAAVQLKPGSREVIDVEVP